MGVVIRNPSVEICSLPSPLQGALKGGQSVILSYTLTALLAACPSLDDAFKLTDLGDAYAGANDDTSFGYEVASPGPLAITGAISATTTMTAGTGFVATAGGLTAAAGDLAALGGFRQQVGPFVQDNVSASQAAVALGFGATDNPQNTWVASRAGSLMGIQATFTVAPAGSSLVLSVYKNGSLMHASAILTVTVGASLGRTTTFAKDTTGLTFVANDILSVRVTTDGSWSATTSDVAVCLEVEQ